MLYIIHDANKKNNNFLKGCYHNSDIISEADIHQFKTFGALL